MANPRLFVLDMKFKSRWKMTALQTVLGIVFVMCYIIVYSEASTKCVCDFGVCVNNTCQCYPGWTGTTCGRCVGRVRLTADHGFISDGIGNYTVDSKCAWLVDTGEVNKTIRLHLEEFATECGWDHIFIHDGDSAFSPLTAAYSGRMVWNNATHDVSENKSETATHSGKAYIHFYSDAAYSIAGFNISYRFGGCPKDCSGHGRCNNLTTETCDCDLGWMGPACDVVDCQYHCINSTTPCSPQCICELNSEEAQCVARQKTGYWEPVGVDHPPHPRTSHGAVVMGDSMWVVGGYNFYLKPFQAVVRYEFLTNTWESLETTGDIPEERFGHSLVGYKDNLYMYGGFVNGKKITNQLYKLNTTSLTWCLLENLTVGSVWRLPVAVTGHTAHVVDDVMLVIFGHSPNYGYMHNIQQYTFDRERWDMVRTEGALVRGAYGHSSVYDDKTGHIYVFGGSSRETKGAKLSDQLVAYNVLKHNWYVLKRSNSPRYLHSMVLLNGFMFVFGGNTHDEPTGNHIQKCYSSDLLAYDLGVNCDSWTTMSTFDARTKEKLARYGHTSVVYKDEIYTFGGFSGVMMNDLFKYTPGNCSKITDKNECMANLPGVHCEWTGGQCVLSSSKLCPASNQSNAIHCGELRRCIDCQASVRECFWCDNVCSAKVCEGESQHCPAKYSHRCNETYNCQLCKTENDCKWNSSKCQYGVTSNKASSQTSLAECSAPCDSYTSCKNCTTANCMWCSNLERCVETNSYTASFPYGICQEWTMHADHCPRMMCDKLKTCTECQANPRCGWCNAAVDTGLGHCMEGGDSGDNGDTCPADRWFFTSCPLCQCNGHSQCKNGTDVCLECQSYTTGRYCEKCQAGYFGDATSGGYCKPCECNGQADMCDPDSGDCFCRTKGVTGPRCDRCDDVNQYSGNAKSGTCYYTLATDYQYTFDLSKKIDEHHTQINFVNIPTASDRDVEFTVNCSSKSMINITWHSKSYPEEQLIMSPVECGYVKRKFEHKSYNFVSSENTTFRIYVHDFKTPFWLQISFVMISSFDIFLFVAIFIGCFLGLMLLAALLWKFKQKYDMYRRRQRMVVELEQMASRPFATVCAEIEPKVDPYNVPGALAMKREPTDVKRKKVRSPNKPCPIGYEPLYGNKVAVISMLVRLPTGDEDFTPPGQSGLAVASALVTLGSQRKPSLEKGDKSKSKKHTHPSHPDTCI